MDKPDLVGFEPKALGISSKVELSNSIVGPDTFVGDVLGHLIAGLIIRGLNPIGRVTVFTTRLGDCSTGYFPLGSFGRLQELPYRRDLRSVHS